VGKIHNLTAQALQRPDTKKRLESLAYTVSGNQPEEFAAFIKSEIEKTAKILKQTGAPLR
jgi:tripartite-type tricarboxylate transporter receptor subunit TctC